MPENVEGNSVPEGYDILEQINLELKSIDGAADYRAAALGFIKGDLELDDAIEAMTRVLHGDGYGNAEHRRRIIELAQTAEERCGFITITVSIAGCTAAFSCSMGCC
ncbi:hypothetical protein GT755_31770 [Herbidospora sp. NEAU-GS84]|uniref:Uncharacterized protein n=1 Tax=Herbidospora solisilvae TaxID=2696284 RepID=A0A7C9NLF4_9ACTN|nr:MULTISPECIES: hypothetical protein [Herbidospora]NAS26238.1 hypothetical protein [Herbidospora solisilvae]